MFRPRHRCGSVTGATRIPTSRRAGRDHPPGALQNSWECRHRMEMTRRSDSVGAGFVQLPGGAVVGHVADVASAYAAGRFVYVGSPPILLMPASAFAQSGPEN